MQPSTVVILGSTGSIGTQGLDVISRHLDRFTVTGLAAGGAHVELLAQQAAKFHVPTVAIFYKEAVPRYVRRWNRPAQATSTSQPALTR